MIQSACPSIKLQSVMHLGPAPALKGDEWTLVGQDGGQSIDLGDATLFVFSDTLLADCTAVISGNSPNAFTRSNSRFLGNCAGISRGVTLPSALAAIDLFRDFRGWPREILPRSGTERIQGLRFWPEHGVLIDGLVYLFYIGIRQFDPRNTWGFEVAGSGLAVLNFAQESCQRIFFHRDWRLWDYKTTEIHWGVQTLVEDNTAYIFGTRRSGLHYNAVLAQVPAEKIADPTVYKYLSTVDPEWSDRQEHLMEITPCGSEYSVSFNAYLGCYLMAYVDGYDKVLYLRTALRPWGPYSQPYSVGKLPHRETTDLISLGFEHPKFARDGGKSVVISYCQPRFTQNSLVSITFQ